MTPFQDQHVCVDGLRIVARAPDGSDVVIVDDVGFSLARGEVLALIGESGSGKTTVALAMLGYFRSGARACSGSIRVGEADLLVADEGALRDLRGNRIAYVAQSAASAFNPSRTIMDQIVESVVLQGRPRAEAERHAIELFRALHLPHADTLGRRYPHQFSGGQLQRLMAAMALMSEPELIILDEPTTALDVTTQIGVLQAFREAVRSRGTTAIYVSHDLAVVAQMADQIVVLKGGRAVETGTTSDILERPRHDYTRALIGAARPSASVAITEPEPARSTSTPLLEVRGLSAGYGRRNAQGEPQIPVLHDISFTLRRGEMLGVIGESGSGKSTLARVIAGLVPPARGDLILDGVPLAPDLAARSRDALRRVQLVFQNADTALNPAQTVSQILRRPLALYHGDHGEAADQRIAELLDCVCLPRSIASRRCTDISGGQKQRVNLARALAANPDVMLCDEVTSALDVVVGDAIMALLSDLRKELGIGIVLVSHDISTVRAMCDNIMVLYGGHAVDQGPRQAFGDLPYHPYTNMLIGSVPELRPGWLPEGEMATALPPINPTETGSRFCGFLGRCASRKTGRCDTMPPPRHLLASGNRVLCHLDEHDLAAQDNRPS